MQRTSSPDTTDAAPPLPHDGDDVQGKLAARLRADGDALFLEGLARLGQSAPETAIGMIDLLADDHELPLLANLLRSNIALRLDAARSLALYEATKSLPPEDQPGGANDQARARAFTRDPGRYLPGAARAPRFFRAPPAGLGHVLFLGLIHPWGYVAEAYAKSDLAELVSYAEDAGLHRGIGVGTRATGDRLVIEGLLPRGFAWASVDLGPSPVTPFRGRAA